MKRENQFVRPVYERFVETAYLTGQLKLDPSVDRAKLAHAEFVSPAWIDPRKEIEADQLAVESRFKSRAQIIRELGGDPEAVRKQLLLEQEQDKADGV
jgi:capsid protein